MTIARDIMTTDVVSVAPETPVREIAALLAARHISAAPVVDAGGVPVGMVSEGDLIGRSQADQEARREWWLEILAEGEALNPEFVATVRPVAGTAEKIMSAPLISIDEATDIVEIARLLEQYRIKRVPVLRDGRIVGIVSRADLVRALSLTGTLGETHEPAAHGLLGAIAALDQRFHSAASSTSPVGVVAPASPINAGVNAQRFRELAEGYRHREHQHHDELQRAAADHVQVEVRALSEHHLDDGAWRAILEKAAVAADRGDKEYLLLRFPNALCSDGGRAINAPLPDWQRTLRGEPAEVYLRWEHELKRAGFHLNARVLEFPGGFPGDIGLFLSWGV